MDPKDATNAIKTAETAAAAPRAKQATAPGRAAGGGRGIFLCQRALIALSRRAFIALASAVIAAAMASPSALAASSFTPLSVVILVSEPTGLARTAEPVTVGIPIPKVTNLLDVNTLRVVTADGITPIPAQFQVLSRWDGLATDTTRPIKWVLVDFQADAPASATATYYLKDGGSGSAGSGINVTTAVDRFTVSTGSATFGIGRTTFNLFDTVDVGLGPLINLPVGSGLTLVSAAGSFSSSKITPTTVAVETAGPMHTVIRAQGRLSNGVTTLKGGNAAAVYGGTAQNLELEYVVRLHFYKNKGFVRVEETLVNDGNGLNGGWANNSLNVNALSFDTTVNFNAARTVVMEGATSAGALLTDSFDLVQTHAVVDPLDETKNFSYSVKKNGSVLASGTRARGFLDVADANQGMTVALRYFWQTYPKAMRAAGNQISVNLLPSGSSAYVQRGGQYISYELMYNFHPGSFASANGDAAVAAFQDPVGVRAEPSWYAMTQAWGLMAPAGLVTTDPTRQEAFDRFERYQRIKVNAAEASNSKSILTYREQRELGADWYGWNDFGDMRWKSFNPPAPLFSGIQYDWPYSLQLHYLRSGKRGFLDLGMEMVNHMADFDIHHGSNTTAPAWFKGQAFWEDGGHNATPYTFVGLMEQNQGYCLAYLLTGRPRFLDTCKLSADEAWTYWTIYLSTAPNYIRSESRIYGWAILRLLTYYKVSGDATYLNNALTIFTSGLLANEQGPPPPAGIGSNGQGFIYDDPGTNDCSSSGNYQVRVLMMGYITDPLVELHRLSGNTAVRDFLIRMLNYARTKVYVGGTTNTSGNYLPRQVPYCFNPATNARQFRDIQVIYNYFFASGYAYLYAITRDTTHLDFARNLFKDSTFYWDEASNTALPPATRSAIYLAYQPQTSKQHGWIGRFHEGYLSMEYESLRNGGVLPAWYPGTPPAGGVGDTTPPAPPTGVQVH